MGMGKEIRRLRLARGWSLPDLEEKSGVAVGTISALEVRDSERSKYYPVLAKALGVSVEQLQAGEAGLVYAHGGAAAPLVAKEPGPDAWPFPLIDRKRIEALNGDQRGLVQARMLDALRELQTGPTIGELLKQQKRPVKNRTAARKLTKRA
jgi:transcriptional regulator with XRE-family HTH domain